MLEQTQAKISTLIRARYPYLYLHTWEEARAQGMLTDMVTNTQSPSYIERKLFVWTQTEGIKQCTRDGYVRVQSEATSLRDALSFVEKEASNVIFILKDVHIFFSAANRAMQYETVRRLRDLLPVLQTGAHLKTVIFLAPVLTIPEEMQKEITVVDFPLPCVEEIEAVIDTLMEINRPLISKPLSPSDKRVLSEAALGMTEREAENAFSRALIERRCLELDALDIIFEEKQQVIKKSGILEYVGSNVGIDDIGGLETMKRWLQKRKDAWSKSAKEYALSPMKGILIIGVPGCGKSLTAKAMSGIWGLPLLRLDLGKIFSGLVGSSEENMRSAIHIAEAMAPCVLWIDEIEKGISADGHGDSGTSSRVLATLLTWMQEKTSNVFIIATANDISNIRPELARKGRFDELFFVDLPTYAERKRIFQLHIEKRRTKALSSLDVNDSLLNLLAGSTQDFSGAEIENVVSTALFEAFSEKRNLSQEDLLRAIHNTVPLAHMQREKISQLRDWAQNRAISASAHEDFDQGVSGSGRVLSM